MFLILYIMLMMLCFFGMRRRMTWRCHPGAPGREFLVGKPMPHWGGHLPVRDWGTRQQHWREGGVVTGDTTAILLTTITHLTALLVLAPNGCWQEEGGRMLLPCLGAVMLWVEIVFGG